MRPLTRNRDYVAPRTLVASRIAIKQLWIDRNLGARFRGLSQRQSRVEQMPPDIINSYCRGSVRQYDHANACLWIEAHEAPVASRPAAVHKDLTPVDSQDFPTERP